MRKICRVLIALFVGAIFAAEKQNFAIVVAGRRVCGVPPRLAVKSEATKPIPASLLELKTLLSLNALQVILSLVD